MIASSLTACKATGRGNLVLVDVRRKYIGYCKHGFAQQTRTRRFATAFRTAIANEQIGKKVQA